MTTGGYTQAQVNLKKAAINGHPDQTACHGWYNAFGSNGKAGNYVPRLVIDTNGTLVRRRHADQQLPAALLAGL